MLGDAFVNPVPISSTIQPMKNMHKYPCSLPAAFYRQLLASGLLLVSTSAMMQAANVDTDWKTEGGLFSDTSNWTNGVPTDLSPADVNRAFFKTIPASEGNPAINTFNVDVDGNHTFGRLYTNQGTTVNLNMQAGSSLDMLSIIAGDDNASTLNVQGPETGSASFTYSGYFQIGTGLNNSGSTANFSGANLTVTDTGTGLVVGRGGSGNTLRLSDGVQWQGRAASVASTADVSVSGRGLNNTLLVTGEGTRMNLTSEGTQTTLLFIASNNLAGQNASNNQRGNVARIADGGEMNLNGSGEGGALARIRVGFQHYRHNNMMEVTGSGSRVNANSHTATEIGYNGTATFNNSLQIVDGGRYNTEGRIWVVNHASIAPVVAVNNGTNYLLVGDNGSTLATSDNVDIDNALLRLESGGRIIAEDLEGNAATAAININGIGRFEAAGLIGNGITVNIGNGGAAAFGFGAIGGYTSARIAELDGELNFNTNSVADFAVFNDGSADQILIGTTGMVNIGEGVGLNIVSTGQFVAGDSFSLFAGNLGAITGAFNTDLISIPSLGENLQWDFSQFTAEYGYTLSVTAVPEPSIIALALALGTTGFVLVRRRRNRC